MKTTPPEIAKQPNLLVVLLFTLLIFLIFSSTAKAQTGVYATFTAGKTGSPNTDWVYGPSVGAYFDSSHFQVVELGLDFRGIFLGGNGSTQIQSGLGGPRLVGHLPLIPFKPYVEILAGVGHVQTGTGASQSSATKFQYQGLIGADTSIFPRIDWRVIEFSYGGLPGFNGGTNPKTISTGLVFRIPML